MKLDTIGKRKKYARFLAGMTQRNLNVALGLFVDQSSIGQYERGLNEPRTKTLGKIAKVLNCDPAWLAFGTGEPPKIEE